MQNNADTLMYKHFMVKLIIFANMLFLSVAANNVSTLSGNMKNILNA
jgi:hypothetical protein